MSGMAGDMTWGDIQRQEDYWGIDRPVITDYDLDAPSPYAYGDNKTIRQVLACDFKAYHSQPSYYTIDGPCADQIEFLAPFVEAGILATIITTNDSGQPALLYTLNVPLSEAIDALNKAESAGYEQEDDNEGA